VSNTKPPGIGVDAFGGAVVDPTKNVLDLVEAANRRQDDLRQFAERLQDAKIEALRQMAVLRADHNREMTVVHSEHDRQIHRAEQDRLNSIREIDVNARVTEAGRNLSAIQTLAASQARDTETLRATVASTAEALARQTQQQVGAIIDRIAQLEKASYTGMGKEAVIDPQMERLSKLVEDLVRSQNQGAGRGAGLNLAWVILGGAIAMVGGLMAIGGMVYAVLPK
jgi:tetrahydromethanopterin S-methyltransferase subunit F